jgi:dihydrofolate reductase
MKASVFIATSLDGFIARSDGGLDWLPEGGGEPHGYTEFMATVDALVIGRKTFETVLSFPEWPYGTKPVIVLSSSPATVEAPPGAMCTFMAATPAEVIDRLAARGMDHLYIDGLIQRLIITRVPVVLGTGIPLFGPVAHDLRFAHVATRAYPSGLVQSEYVVAA